MQRRDCHWRFNAAYATLDLSGPYRQVFDTTLPWAYQIADPFHLVKLANAKIDECRRRVQNEVGVRTPREVENEYRAKPQATGA